MSKTKIYKYDLRWQTGIVQTISVPKAYLSLLDIQQQGNDLVAWCEVTEAWAVEAAVEICIAFTGDSRPKYGFSYFKTLQKDGLVFHIYVKP